MTPMQPSQQFLSDKGLHENQRIAVVDIGSNSVRLVVFDRAARVLVPLFNEKVFCSLGRNVASTGRLDDVGVSRAMEALNRFRELIINARVSIVQAVATAAVRDAKNGPRFVADATEVLGAQVKTISGEDEAHLSALGVICGIPDAEGVVGDLGGGSLELVGVSGLQVGHATSLGLGPLRLMDQGLTGGKTTRSHIDKELAGVEWLNKNKGQTFYLVGGAWRNLARLHLEQNAYPLTILQQYTIDGNEAREFCRSVSKLGRKSLEGISSISKKRIEVLPLAALILERLLEHLESTRIVVSANGLREGLVAEVQGPEFLATDPLLAAAREFGGHMARDEGLCAELAEWTAPLFPNESDYIKRLRISACWLSDIAWRVHPEYRAEVAFGRILGEQFSGLDHPGRAFLASVLLERYPGGRGLSEHAAVRKMLPVELYDQARILGRALRLGMALGGAVGGTLPHCPISLEAGKPSLTLPPTMRGLMGEAIEKRLGAVADAFDKATHLEDLL